ncbi:hypothetical protein [Paenibacillus sp. OSY-SE]|uniref:hypothetical protein n=1 Tax=Paenibacillus sp. OSY-SE TaxID=1196323 RepID=UPI000378C558|nr:hypothetical protein [Paenibacillus sp. OSY-SE]
MSTSPSPDSHPVPAAQRAAAARMARIMDPNHPLCREDIVWVLNVVKQKLTDQDEAWSKLEPERVIRNFRYFAEVSLLLIRNSSYGQESDRIRQYLAEAVHGLWDKDALEKNNAEPL